MAEQALVILVPGLWMNGLELVPLERRLRRCGFRTTRFRYHSVADTIAENAARLHAFAVARPDPIVHFVGHSLGGLVVLDRFLHYPEPRPGRIVAVGSPFQGSWAAQRMARHRWGRWMLGRSFEGALAAGLPAWDGRRAVGVIAGSLAIGFGRLFRGLAQPNDGTVAVAETWLPAATDHLTLPLSHISLVLSVRTARAVCTFLKTGRFDEPPQQVD